MGVRRPRDTVRVLLGGRYSGERTGWILLCGRYSGERTGGRGVLLSGRHPGYGGGTGRGRDRAGILFRGRYSVQGAGGWILLFRGRYSGQVAGRVLLGGRYSRDRVDARRVLLY